MGKTILVSNRLSTSVSRSDEGFIYTPSIGGLATGLSSFHGEDGSLWIGWSGVADDELSREEAQEIQTALYEDHKSIAVPLTRKELEDFYLGFCNNIIWPLFHYFPTYVEYDPRLWEAYVAVNEKFFEAVRGHIEDGDRIWVHDYQLMLLPKMIKEQFPNVEVGFFLHIPFPSYEVFRLLPWRDSVLEGLLGADLVGFHTYDYARHFLSASRRLGGYDHSMGYIRLSNRVVRVDVFPMGIDYDRYAGAGARPENRRSLRSLTKEFAGVRVILSVDRLDYSKGIPGRLKAFRELLVTYPEYRGDVVLFIIVSPSRTKVAHYQELKREVDELVSQINGELGTIDWTPVRYFYRTFQFDELTAIYQRSDVLLVTPIRDGMNLIAKEYVAAKTDLAGVVVLSETAGSARELSEAIIVNPSNTAEIAAALKSALDMPFEEQVEKNKRMHERLKRYTLKSWAEDFMGKLDTVHGYQQSFRVKRLADDSRSELLESFKNAPSRLLLLDYDGTLVGFKDRPEDARPDKELLALLSKLADDPRNHTVIISGRDRSVLDEWLGHLNINLVGGHGVWYRDVGQDWTKMEGIRSDWKESLIPLLQRYVDRTPGSAIEEKDYSVAWHYRRSEPELAAVRLREVQDALLSITENLNLSVLEGNRVLEVKDSNVHKGRGALKWQERTKPALSIAIGDDYTDEDMFRSLPDTAWTVKVGYDISNARFFLESNEEVRTLLKELTKT